MPGRGEINKQKPLQITPPTLPSSGLQIFIYLFLLQEEYSYFALSMLPPLWYQFPISGILEFYQSTFHLSSVHKKGSSDLFPGRGSWLRFTKCFLNNLPSEGEQRLEFSYCVYNIAAIRNRTTSQYKKTKKKPEHHVRRKKPATVDTEEPSVPAVSKNKPTLRQADSVLPLHTGPRASSPSRRHSRPKEPCAGGNSSAHTAVTSPCPAPLSPPGHSRSFHR